MTTFHRLHSEALNRLFSRTGVQIFVLMVFCFFLFMLEVGRWDLWNPDEPRYAQVAKEIVEGGDWILMHANGRIYADKPPLFFWLMDLSSYLWGNFGSFSVRFPSALFGALTVLLTFLIGRNLYSSRIGLLSGLILATSMEFVYLSTRGNIDTTLTFFVTASIFCFLRWHQPSQDRGIQEKLKGFLFYGVYVGMALATLTKGPVGLILPLLVILTYLFLQKEGGSIRRMKLPSGMILCLAIVLFWYLPAVMKGGESYLHETLLRQTVGRFAGGTAHLEPFYYYLINFPGDFLPWFLFLPGAIVLSLNRKGRNIPAADLFSLIWFVSIFVFFSMSKGKRPIYLLPLYPAASLLVGRLWGAFLSGEAKYSIQESWISLPISLLSASLFIAGIVLVIVPEVAKVPLHSSTPGMLSILVNKAGVGMAYLTYLPHEVYLLMIIFFLGMSVTLLLAYTLKQRAVTFILMVAVVGIGFFYGTRVIFPLVNPYKSARYISEDIKGVMKPGDRLAMYGDFGSAGTAPYNFYTGVVPILEITSEGEAVDFFRSGEEVFCILRYQDYEALNGEHRDVPLHLLVRRGVGHNDLALVTNR